MQSTTDKQPGSEELANGGMFASPDQAVRVLKKVIIGLGIAIAVVMVVMGVLIYHRLSDDKAAAPQSPVTESAPAAETAAVPADAKPGAIEGAHLVAPVAGQAGKVAHGVIALKPGERVVRFQIAGAEIVLLVETQSGAQELVTVDRATGAVRARLAVVAQP